MLLLFLKFWHVVLKFLVVIRLVVTVVQDSVVIKTVNENLLLSSSPDVSSICGRMYQRNFSGRRLQLINDSHCLLLEYLASLDNAKNPDLKTGFTAYPRTKGSFLPLLRRSTNKPERQKTYFHRVQGLCWMNFDTSDSCVNTLIVAYFNLLSHAIQGDTLAAI